MLASQEVRTYVQRSSTVLGEYFEAEEICSAKEKDLSQKFIFDRCVHKNLSNVLSIAFPLVVGRVRTI